MTCNPKRTPVSFTTVDGTECLRVPLARARGEAIIEADDMHSVAACGVSAEWSFDSNGSGRRYVRGNRSPGNRAVSIARAVARAGRGQCVGYHDANPLNLRRDSLYLTEGRSRMDCASLIEYAEGEPKHSAQIFAPASNEQEHARSPRGAPPRHPGRTEAFPAGCA